MLIVGSVAAADHYHVGRAPKDLDLIVNANDVEAVIAAFPHETSERKDCAFGEKIVLFGDQIVEIEIPAKGTAMRELLPTLGSGTAPLWLLYALKMSHRYLKNSPAFLKTMHDIHEMRRIGVRLTDEQYAWMLRRQKETLHYQHPNLDRDKDEFFGADTVRYFYDHDRIHEIVAVGDEPAYLSYKFPDKEVLCDPKRFFRLPHEVRLNGVVEEARVLAYERSIVPHGTNPHDAFRLALQKVCTSITSGWFREYAWENYSAALYRGMSDEIHQQIVLDLRKLEPLHPEADNTLLEAK